MVQWHGSPEDGKYRGQKDKYVTTPEQRAGGIVETLEYLRKFGEYGFTPEEMPTTYTLLIRNAT